MPNNAKAKKVFNQIYDQYIDKIYRFVFLKVNSQQIAQDLTSEIFLRFWESLDSPAEVENPKAFIYQIARNLVVDHYRDKSRVNLIPIESVELKDPDVNIEEQASLASDMTRVQKALAELKPDHQDAIIWYYLDEFSIVEIAEFLDKSENAVRLIIHRTLKLLRKDLE